MAVNFNKNRDTALQLCEAGDTLLEDKKFQLSLDFYTLSLLYSPAVCENDQTPSVSENNKDHLMIQLYYNRSLAHFRLKKYKSCADDIKRAFANGKHAENRCVELLSRLAWCYWHLKEYKKCAEVVNSTKLRQNGACKELDLLESLIAKSKVMQNNIPTGTKSPNKIPEQLAESLEYALLKGGEHKLLKGVSSRASWNLSPDRGRYLTANETIKPGSTIISEEAFSGVLTAEFAISNCNYCFKECKYFGIPCYGCSKALYCNEECRRLAWQSYHWLECCMWPVLEKLDIFAHLAFRTVLCAAHESSKQETAWCSLIAEYLHHALNDTQAKSTGKRKNAKKSVKNRPDPKMDGRNPDSKMYEHNYWSVFCLQEQEDKHTKINLTKCTLYANYLSKVLNRLPSPPSRKQPRTSTGDHASVATDVTANNLKNAFHRLSLSAFCDDRNDKSSNYHDMETFRQKTLEVCKNMAANAPMAKLKPQSCFFSKDIPRSFQEVVGFLLRRHMLQLQTNCQAIFDIISENPDALADVSTVSQKRIASAIFPSTSLLNHSCNPNTYLAFTGRNVSIRTVNSILEGDEITHCYGPSMSRNSFKDRQVLLKEQYFFDCSCTTCAKYKTGDVEDQVFLQQFTAYKCSYCEGPILILDSKGPDDMTSYGKCANEACKRVYDLAAAQLNYNEIVSASNTISQRLLKSPSDDDFKLLEDCLEEFRKIVFHNHHTIASLHDQLAFHYSRKKDYKLAAKHVTASLKITSMRFGSESVEAAQELYKLGSLYFNCQMRAEAEKFLNKSLEINRKISNLEKAEVIKAEAMLLALKAFSNSKSAKK